MCSRTASFGPVSSLEGFIELCISCSNSESSPAILIHRCEMISGTVIRRRGSVHSSRRIRSSHSTYVTQHKTVDRFTCVFKKSTSMLDKPIKQQRDRHIIPQLKHYRHIMPTMAKCDNQKYSCYGVDKVDHTAKTQSYPCSTNPTSFSAFHNGSQPRPKSEFNISRCSNYPSLIYNEV